MGATTQAINSGDSWVTIGNRRGVFATITMSSSYATGGDTVTARAFGLASIDEVDILSQPAGYVLEFDKTNLKIKAFRTGTVTPAGTNSKPTFTVEASGAIGSSMEIGLSVDTASATVEGGTGITAQRALTTTSPVGIPTFTGTATTAAALAEVGSGVDLSTVIARTFVMGW